MPIDTSGIIPECSLLHFNKLQVSGIFITGRNLRIRNAVTYLKANIGGKNSNAIICILNY